MLKAWWGRPVPPGGAGRDELEGLDFATNPPIFVYQMGKVGSSTVCESLKNAALPNPVFQVHFLSHEGLERVEAYYAGLEHGMVPDHIRLGKRLRAKIDGTQDGQWRIITLVREPISRDISNFFQNVGRSHPDLVDAQGNLYREQVLECLQEQFARFDESTDYVCTWFDRELKSTFGVDVYAHPFPRHEGFVILRDRNVAVLVLRMEDLDASFGEAVQAFLGLERPIEVVRANVGRKKAYAEDYAYTVKNLVIPREVCSKIYSSRYARHFYSKGTRDELLRRWSGEHDR